MTVYSHIARNKFKTAVLMSLFIAVIVGLGWFFGTYYAQDAYAGIGIAVVISLFMTFISYFAGDKIALATSGAKQIQREDSPYLWNMVENVAITAGVPMPKVYVIEDAAMNAFATGRSPKNASVAFTTGIVNNLENEELEAVTAHELSHIKNYDVRVMMIIAVLVGSIALIADLMFRWQLFGGRRSNDEAGRAQIVVMVVGLVLLILSPIIAELIKLAVSRKREYLADASAVLITRYADGLASALRKIAAQEHAGANQLRTASKATAHLFLANPFKPNRAFSRLFSTHPPIEDRIKALEEMSGRPSA